MVAHTQKSWDLKTVTRDRIFPHHAVVSLRATPNSPSHEAIDNPSDGPAFCILK